jgi:phosphoribosylformimino-5-aminoimidazole carboxamide ribotide isomerase
MEIWPAIDLRGGNCVRLRQGDYAQETVFGDDPAAMARHWVDLGGQCLHLVDLDGAKDGKLVNLEAVRAIVSAVRVPCELGGGIRSEESIDLLLDLGVSRLVVGTLAIKKPDWFASVCRKYPGKMVLGIDARQGQVATDGWLETSEISAVELARQFADMPLCAINYTDISTDGMMTGPNIEAMVEMKQAVSIPVIASGGVTCAKDVANLAQAGLDGCIIGRALYEETLTLPDALRAAESKQI